jgi:Lon protease-like protein
MAASRPGLSLAELPETIPVFPLPGVLLLPRGRLPLNIFEPRYVAMTEAALAQPTRLIGMIQPAGDGPGENPELYPVGCAGRIVSFSESEDSRYRYLITLIGVCRFTIAAEVAGERGFRRVRADWSRWRADLDPPGPCAMDRERFLRTLKGYFAANDISADWDAIADAPDDRLITTLAMVCPFSPSEKQALLEAEDADARAKAVMALMEMAARGGADADRPRH